jgi:hypothetical protein
MLLVICIFEVKIEDLFVYDEEEVM